MSRNVNLLTQV